MQGWIPYGNVDFEIDCRIAPHMVVFSHGFGVQRDSRGMFTEIVNALPESVGYVLFDYNDIDAAHGLVHANGFSDMVRKLQVVIDWTRKLDNVEQVSLVGHSLGSLVIADLSPADMCKIVLLAPPTTSRGEARFKRYTEVPGAQEIRGVWHIPRRDGTTTLVSESVFDELAHVDAEGELVKLAMFQTYDLVIAEADDVLLDDDYTELMVMDTIASFGIKDASHNFEGAARPELLKIVIEQLTK